MPLTLSFGRSHVLPVPYWPQPTGITCQSTCLKMMASYLEESVVRQSTGAADREIQDIWKDVNQTGDRPDKKHRNAHVNLKWWLESHFPTLRFDYLVLHDEAAALERIVQYIDSEMPVLMSVSHAHVAGHIVLVVGYQNHRPRMSSADFHLVVHDPYGKFDPTLLSKLYGKRRWEGGASLMGGGSTGPGKNCRLPLTSASKQGMKDPAKGTYYLLAARR